MFFIGGAAIPDAEVWLGAAPTVPIVAPRDLQVLVPREFRSELKARVVYSGPVEAPITQGQKLATLEVTVPQHDPVTFELVAGREVPRGGLLTRINAAARLTRDRAVALLPGR
jgi:D-alanyl-D-alanine carboxypeptidase (penicillin-binding protein 5/6)